MQPLCRSCNLKKGRGIDTDQYFKIGVSEDYILLRRDFPITAFKGREFDALIRTMFKRNDEVLGID